MGQVVGAHVDCGVRPGKTQGLTVGVEEAQRVVGKQRRRQRQPAAFPKRYLPARAADQSARRDMRREAALGLFKLYAVIFLYAAGEGPAEAGMKAAGIGHWPAAAIDDSQAHLQRGAGQPVFRR